MLIGYATIIHSGSGRLRLTALGFVLLILTTDSAKTRLWKLATILGSPLAIAWLASSRQARRESLHAGASRGLDGLESMINPVEMLARIIEADVGGMRQLRWGATFATPLMSVLPEAFTRGWMPEAFGYEIVALQRPELVGTGFSLAGSLLGEFVYNFSIAGLVVAPIIAARSLRLIDRRLQHGLLPTDRPPATEEGWHRLLWVVAAAAVADLAWGGVHIYTMRTVPRLVAIAMIAYLSVPRRASIEKSNRGREEPALAPIQRPRHRMKVGTR